MSMKLQVMKLEGDWVSRPKWYRFDQWLSNWWHNRNVLPKNPETLTSHPAYRGTVEKVVEE